jgi:hypothetical protein
MLIKIFPVRFELLMPMTVKVTASWDVELCSLVDKYQCFGGICCLSLQGRGTNSSTLHGVIFQKAVIFT